MKKIFLIIASAVLVASCTDMLNTSPYNQIATENMWTTETLTESGITGLYRVFYCSAGTDRVGMSSGSIDGFDRQTGIALEYQTYSRSDDQNYLLTYATKSAGTYNLTYEWKWNYTGIHRCNDAIEGLREDVLGTALYERYMCEARWLRAYFYARLNMFFQGVPIYLEPVSNENCTKGQSTAEEVWNVVLDDLNYCIDCENFPNNTLSTSTYGRASKGAAYALRGEAYLWLAYLNNHDTAYYQLAANDFEMVSECGYGLWEGEYIDFYNDDSNEKSKEMIFPLQFSNDSGYGDYIDIMFASGDNYNGYATFRPNSNFVDYYQNADGSTFNWVDVIPEWNNSEFTSSPEKREVFFLRDSISLDANGNVVRDYWNDAQAGQIQERIEGIGLSTFNTYYLKDGNEDRIRSAYNNRDPRLKQTILTPYDPYDTYCPTMNNGVAAHNKELRWPLLIDNKKDGDDIYIDQAPKNTYMYKKFVRNSNVMTDRGRTPNDYPVIHYTDVYLHLAECYVRLNRLSEAVAIINEVRQAIGWNATVSVGTADQVFEAVKYERRVSLCAEGADYFDEWRWGTYKEMKFNGLDNYSGTNLWGCTGDTMVWYYADTMFPWSAPASECEKNLNLTRLDGWSY